MYFDVTWPFLECGEACVEVIQSGVGKGREECGNKRKEGREEDRSN